MYHLGVMEVVIRVIAKAMQATMGTSATESMVAAGKIANIKEIKFKFKLFT